MGKIRILPDQLVSKIAAGEIVERPASVVKELIENSIDASSTEIKIDLERGGRKLIAVSDNGIGMTRDEALLSIERHATSKIKDIDDLFSVATLGFRGEALPSIASVSRMSITTKTKKDLEATRIYIEGGKLRRVEEAGAPDGTAIEAKNLFYNTPARLKFMKKMETEYTNVLRVVERHALSSPQIGFQLTHNGKTVMNLAGRDSPEQRLAELFPGVSLHPIRTQSDGITVRGWMSSPEGTRSTTQKMYTFVNGRPVRDKLLTRVLIDAYGKMLDKGKFPQGALFVEMPPESVDVNVHPTKNEVRFKNSWQISGLIKDAVHSMLSQAPWIEGHKARVENAVRGFYEKEAPYGADYSHKNYQSHTPSHTTPRAQGSSINLATDYHVDEPVQRYEDKSTDSTEALFRKEGLYSTLKIIGQLGELYIVCASAHGLLLVDQHAAHERVNYERFKHSYLEQSLETQELLIPSILELTPHDARLLADNLDKFKELGFDIESFGEDAYRVRTVPALIHSADPEGLIKDVLGELDKGGNEDSISEKIDRVISTMACHSSVRANEKLSMEEMEALLAELDASRFPHACPHGRPVAKEITFAELEKMFKRT